MTIENFNIVSDEFDFSRYGEEVLRQNVMTLVFFGVGSLLLVLFLIWYIQNITLSRKLVIIGACFEHGVLFAVVHRNATNGAKNIPISFGQRQLLF